MTLKVFVSWSGETSMRIGEALTTWLPRVLQETDPWFSPNLDSGVEWLSEVNKALADHGFGLLIVTPSNVKSPWLNFEAGALSKQFTAPRVIPILHDYSSPSDLAPPLGQFNAVLLNRGGIFKMVKSLNTPLSDVDLDTTFNVWWPKLEAELDSIPSEASPASRRSNDDKLDELLTICRQWQAAEDEEENELPDVREWARANGWPVSDRGRVANHIWDAYFEEFPEAGAS